MGTIILCFKMEIKQNKTVMPGLRGSAVGRPTIASTTSHGILVWFPARLIKPSVPLNMMNYVHIYRSAIASHCLEQLCIQTTSIIFVDVKAHPTKGLTLPFVKGFFASIIELLCGLLLYFMIQDIAESTITSVFTQLLLVKVLCR